MLYRCTAALAVAFLTTCSSHPIHEAPPPPLAAVPEVSVEALPKAPLCPDDMVEVQGSYCPIVQEKCLRWKEKEKLRCLEFQKPTVCASLRRIPMHFCIDRYEYPDVKGQRPRSWVSFNLAQWALRTENKRVCSTEEWTLACEGPDMKPYPYGDGYHRDESACNIDLPIPQGGAIFRAKKYGDRESQVLDALLAEAGSFPNCKSDYGVYDQVGNLDEFVYNSHGTAHARPYISTLMGGFIFGFRNRCRAQTTAHDPNYNWYETGTRGCLSLPE